MSQRGSLVPVGAIQWGEGNHAHAGWRKELLELGSQELRVLRVAYHFAISLRQLPTLKGTPTED